MNPSIRQISQIEAGEFAADLIRTSYGVDMDTVTDAQIENLINCLFTVRRARMAKKFSGIYKEVI